MKKWKKGIENSKLVAILKGTSKFHLLQEALPDHAADRDLAWCVPFQCYLTDSVSNGHQSSGGKEDQAGRGRPWGLYRDVLRTCHGAATELHGLHTVHLAFPAPGQGENS